MGNFNEIRAAGCEPPGVRKEPGKCEILQERNEKNKVCYCNNEDGCNNPDNYKSGAGNPALGNLAIFVATFFIFYFF